MEGHQTSEAAVGDHVPAPPATAGAARPGAPMAMGNHAFAAAAALDAHGHVAVPPPAPPPAGDAAIELGLARAVQRRAAAVAREAKWLPDKPRSTWLDVVAATDAVRRQKAESLERELEELYAARAAIAVQVQPAIVTAAAALADPNVDAATVTGQVGGLAPLLYNLGADQHPAGLSVAIGLDEAAAALRAAARPREETMAAAKRGLADAMTQLETAIEAGGILVPGPPGEDPKPQLAPEVVTQLQAAHAGLATVHAGLDGYTTESEFADAAGQLKHDAGSIAAAGGRAPAGLAATLTAAFRTAIVAAADVGALGRDRATNLVVARDRLRSALPLVGVVLEVMGGQAERLRAQIDAIRPPDKRRFVRPATDI